ncbi:ribonuclease PH [soil metagenome]
MSGSGQARSGRTDEELRKVQLTRGVSDYAEGSCQVAMGNTRVLCVASVEQGVPGWRKGSGAGWLTAEYSMLPRATHTRSSRERGQIGGRTQEIQRLIGRSLRACVDLRVLGEWTIRIDCDVLQADGGTRTAAITGASVALHEACSWIQARSGMASSPMAGLVAAVSAGLIDGAPRLDLDYSEDSRADVDLNVVALETGGLIEVQGTGEKTPFTPQQLSTLVGMADGAIQQLFKMQRAVLSE